MGCLIVVFSLLTPRIVLLVLWLTDYLEKAYTTWIWPTLGFFFLPTTTIAYALAVREFSSSPTVGGTDISAAGVIVIVIGVLIDLGVLGGGARSRR
ncbi:MAG TPA: hypothetical protein VLA82_04545 [Actinomycetota bacterium]|nr:hypothetical protein [Actinomycetota bacterium]